MAAEWLKKTQKHPPASIRDQMIVPAAIGLRATSD
jgi:hypothetical protein